MCSLIAGRGLSTIKDFYGLNLELCQALMAYMKLRRNECESCEFLIHLGFRFEKLSLQLQTGVYEAFKRLETLRGSGPRAASASASSTARSRPVPHPDVRFVLPLCSCTHYIFLLLLNYVLKEVNKIFS